MFITILFLLAGLLGSLIFIRIFNLDKTEKEKENVSLLIKYVFIFVALLMVGGFIFGLLNT